MKKIFFIVAMLFAAATFAQNGHYRGGKGSSHKGGRYKNSSTDNHYRKHKKG